MLKNKIKGLRNSTENNSFFSTKVSQLDFFFRLKIFPCFTTPLVMLHIFYFEGQHPLCVFMRNCGVSEVFLNTFTYSEDNFTVLVPDSTM